MKKKLYTLEEAYKEILRIKKDMGLNEFNEKQLREAKNEGAMEALTLMKENFDKNFFFLKSIHKKRSIQ